MINISSIFTGHGLSLSLFRKAPSNPLSDLHLSYSGSDKTDYINISEVYGVQIHRSGQCQINSIRLGHNDPRSAQIKKLAFDLLKYKAVAIPEGFEFLNKYAEEQRFRFSKENQKIHPRPYRNTTDASPPRSHRCG